MRDCPPDAFYDQPIQHENGLVTVLDNAKCFPYFVVYHGCSVCIKVCPFNQQRYDKIKERFLEKKKYGDREGIIHNQIALDKVQSVFVCIRYRTAI